jgi:acetyl-CoA acetyltransferase family protein
MELEPTTVGWRLINPKFPPSWTQSLGSCVERTVAQMGITREEQDAWALGSHSRAQEAWEKGAVANVLTVAGVERDESIREDASLQALAGLQPAFEAGGSLTAGNSSPINDGAAAMILGTEDIASKFHANMMAEFVTSVAVGVAPDQFALAPAMAVRKLLMRSAIDASAVDVWEINEAFAGVVLAFLREMPAVSASRVNVHGGALAYGHPLGASMTRVVSETVRQLEERGGGVGVAAACIGVGQGLAILIRAA